MFTLAAEIDKLSFYVRSHGRDRVLGEDIPLVTCATLENDAFALTNAVLDGKSDKALDALAVMKYERVDPIIILSEITKVICDLALVKALVSAGKTPFEVASALKINEYKARLYVAGVASKGEEKLSRAIDLCVEADRALKLSSGGYDILEQLLSTL
jgi:DNA polymerase-3 subunit delta